MKHCRWIAISVISTRTLTPNSFSIKCSEVTVELVKTTVFTMSYLKGAIAICKIHRLVSNTAS